MGGGSSRSETGGSKPAGFLRKVRVEEEKDTLKFPAPRRKKRPHSLNKAVENNTPSAKKHSASMQ